MSNNLRSTCSLWNDQALSHLAAFPLAIFSLVGMDFADVITDTDKTKKSLREKIITGKPTLGSKK